MNKENISKYLYQLRIARGLNRTEAASSIGTTYKSILDWESGVMPNNESLLNLAKLYKVRVDDILECGQRITNEQIYEEFPIFKPINYSDTLNASENNRKPYQSELLKINKRLKELIIKFKNTILTRSEEFEFRFLFEKMCVFSEYYLEKNPNNKKKDKFLCFLELLNDIKKEKHSNVSYIYEVRKNVDIERAYSLFRPYPEDGDANSHPIMDQQFKSLESWEKDCYLALFQCDDVIIDESDNVISLENYERRTGKQFDKEKSIKNLMKYFIENGAVLNPWLLSFIVKRKTKRDVLTNLEDLYIDYIKPLFIQYYDDNGDTFYGFVENNEESRLLDNYESLRSYTLVCKIDEFFDLIRLEDEKKAIDYLYSKLDRPLANPEERFNKAAVNYRLEEYRKIKEKYLAYKDKEKKNLELIPILEEKLNNNESIYYDYEFEDIAHSANFVHRAKMKEWLSYLSYTEYMKKRDKEKTIDLLNHLDDLSLGEIREKYFEKEVYEQDE